MIKRLCLAALIGIVSVAGFAPFNFPPAIVGAYAWLFWTLAREDRPLRGFWIAYAFGLGHFTGGLYWIGESTLIDFATWGWFWPLATFGLPILLSFYPALAGFLSVKTRWPAFVFFTIAELARATLFTGFPWNMAGSTWIDWGWIVQNADWAGLYGLTFITIFLANLAAQYTSKRAIVLLVITLGILAIYGGLTRRDTTFDKDVFIRIVQPNVPQQIKWEPDQVFGNSLKPLTLSDIPPSVEADENWIIWPETAQASPIWRSPEFKSFYQNMLADWPEGTRVITGYLALDAGIDMANAVIAADTNGTTLWRADKHHLVPFGEYMPLDDILHLGPIVGIEGFAGGAPPRNMEGGIIPLICYEIIFPQYARQAAQPDSRAIVTITDDSWFGSWSGPRQHLVQARLRAIETGLPVLRAANTGISAVIDPYGRVLDSAGLNNIAVIDTFLPERRSVETFQTRFGNLFIFLWLTILFSILFFGKGFFSGN